MSTGRKATAFMSKQRKWIANVRLIMSAFADQNHAQVSRAFYLK